MLLGGFLILSHSPKLTKDKRESKASKKKKKNSSFSLSSLVANIHTTLQVSLLCCVFQSLNKKKMSTVRLEPLLHSCKRDENPILFRHHQLKRSTKLSSFSSTVNYYKCPKLCSNFFKFKPHPRLCSIRASSTAETTVVEADTSGYVLSSDTIQLKFSQKVNSFSFHLSF